MMIEQFKIMREIKFRAWLPSEKTMIQHREVIERSHLLFNDSFNESDIAMQFTGLKDKNGKEIYESDLVLLKLFKNNDGEIGTIVFTHGRIVVLVGERHNDLFGCEGYLSEDANRKRWDDCIIDSVEVIGNIYETNIPA